MSFNEKLSYTEYVVTTPTTDFAFGFEFIEGIDAVHVLVNDVDALEAGYTIQLKNSVTMEIQPPVESGVVRIYRETNIDASLYRFTAGAKFVAANMDANFKQILHAQQEVRDGFTKLAGDVYPLVAGLEDALQKADDASASAQEAADAADAAMANVLGKLNTVESIADLRTHDSVGALAVLVLNYHTDIIGGGGVFVADTSGAPAIDDGGITIIGVNGRVWKRQLTHTYTPSMFGYQSNMSSTATSDMLVRLFKNVPVGSNIDLEGRTYNLDTAILQATSCTIKNGTLVATKSVTYPLVQLSNVHLSNVVFDGSDLSIGGSVIGFGSAFGYVFLTGNFTSVSKCTFKNLHGVQDANQYGVVVDGRTSSLFTQCIFLNIRGRTNSVNTGGFTGGVFVFTPTNIRFTVPVTHSFSQCSFDSIYTTKNAAGQLYSDSDGIRTYFADSSNTEFLSVIEASVITIEGCTFKNVLKSACKVQHITGVFRDCTVVVDDLKDQGQDWVYTGLRYQYGSRFTVSNCTIKGMLRYGLYISAQTGTVEDVTIDLVEHPSTLVQYSIQVGELATPVASTLLKSVRCSHGLFVLGVVDLTVDMCVFKTASVLGKVTSTLFRDTMLAGLDNSTITQHNPTLGSITLVGCKLIVSNARYTYLISTVAYNLALHRCTLQGGSSLVVSTQALSKLELLDCNVSLDFSTSSTNYRFVNGIVTKLRVLHTVVTDKRTTSPDMLFTVSTGNSSTEIRGCMFYLNSNYNYVLYGASGADVSVSDVAIYDMKSGAYAIRTVNGPTTITNLRLSYPTAGVQTHCTSGGVPVYVLGLHGRSLASPAIVVTGTVPPVLYSLGTSNVPLN